MNDATQLIDWTLKLARTFAAASLSPTLANYYILAVLDENCKMEDFDDKWPFERLDAALGSALSKDGPWTRQSTH